MGVSYFHVVGILAVLVLMRQGHVRAFDLHHLNGEDSVEKKDEEVTQASAGRESDENSLPLCPADSDRIECFRFYLSQLAKPEAVSSDDLATTDLPEKRTPTLDSDWKLLCPDYKSKTDCLASYLSLLSVNTPRSIKYKKRSEQIGGKRNTFSWQLCPVSKQKIDCFENYMSVWLHLVSKENKGRLLQTATKGTYRRSRVNRFVGKRSLNTEQPADFPPFSQFSHFCPSENIASALEACFNAYIRLYMRSVHNTHAPQTTEESSIESSNDVNPNEGPGKGNMSVDKNESSKMCKKFSCYLHQAADKIEKSDSTTSENLISNKRSPSQRLCPSYMSTAKCFENYMKLLIKSPIAKTKGAHGKYIGRAKRSIQLTSNGKSKKSMTEDRKSR